jgi:hypothetical protein
MDVLCMGRDRVGMVKDSTEDCSSRQSAGNFLWDIPGSGYM